MHVIPAAKRKQLTASGMLSGMQAIRGRVQGLDISERDRNTVCAAIDQEIENMKALAAFEPTPQ